MKQIGDQVMGVKRMAAMAALMAVAALVIAGCGDSSDATGSGDTDSGPTITKAVLIKKGDAICQKTDDAQAAGLAAFEKKNPGAVRKQKGLEAVIVNAALPPLATEIEELAALGAPKGDEATVGKIIAGWEKALAAAEANPMAIARAQGPFKAPNELAAKYGFKECSNAL